MKCAISLSRLPKGDLRLRRRRRVSLFGECSSNRRACELAVCAASITADIPCPIHAYAERHAKVGDFSKVPSDKICTSSPSAVLNKSSQLGL